jgi:hypothetical protein
MSNTFAAIVPAAFEAAQMVSRELAPAVSSVRTNFRSKIAVGDSLTIPVAPKRVTSTYVPAMTTTTGADTVDAGVIFNLNNNLFDDWHLTGEQILKLQNAGMYEEWQSQMLVQGMRTLVNAMELTTLAAIKAGASRAFGTAGTTPFATGLTELNAGLKILRDNGAYMGDVSLVCDTNAGLNVRNLTQLQKVSEAGGADLLRQGIIGNLFGVMVKESAGVVQHTKGTGAAYVTNAVTPIGGGTLGNATNPNIPMITGSGTALPGDVVTFAADANNKYIINSGLAAPGNLSLGRPGARISIPSANAMTIGNNYMPNVLFDRSAVMLMARAPEIPHNSNITQTVIGDPLTGLSFLLCEVWGDGMLTWRVHAAFGAVANNPEQIAILMG